ncbi:hypothetical protein [Lyngbya confervoides]|uniref:Uncharacterized protein n=1 Tax=Lyngbya confervoides BDU141951 TaxID=1574623 RepID=A0ABD4T8C6_9CYAN|nr:hypothetical protein [Lyngbya confervoides]MCM1984567.1 hypothetical protein [Lyngbya confervoides BDU141951]
MEPFILGSYSHKKLFCELILQGDSPNPAPLNWPELDASAQERLAEMRFWPSLYKQKVHQAQTLASFSHSASGKLLQGAIAQIGQESQAQADFIRDLCQQYQLPSLAPPGPSPLRGEAGFKRSLYNANLELFLGSGLLGLLRQAQYLPTPLLELWASQLQIQARHVMFLANWLVFQTQVRQKPEYESFGAVAIWHQRRWLWELLQRTHRNEYDDTLPESPTQADRLLGQWTFSQILSACQHSYAVQFSAFDPRLVRPLLLPRLAQAYIRMVRFWPQKTDPSPES